MGDLKNRSINLLRLGADRIGIFETGPDRIGTPDPVDRTGPDRIPDQDIDFFENFVVFFFYFSCF